MSFPVSPTNGQIAVVNNVAYEYATANTSWTRVLSIANVIQANVISANVLNVVQAFSITGNIATANYFIGNGAFLTGIAAGYSNTDVANYLPTYIGNLVSLTGPVTTTSNVTGGNILFGTGVVSGTGTVYAATVSTTGNVNSGYISTGPASVGNLISGGFVSATGNVTGGNLSGTNIVGTLTTASQTNITSVGTLGSLTVTANTTSGNLLTGGLVSAAGNVTGGNLITGAQVVASGVIQTGTGFSTGGYLSVDGNTDLHNTTVTGNLSATGNVTGNYILGNGALLTGVITSVANINNGTSNVTVVSSGGNVTVGVAGISNVAVFSADAVNVKGNLLPSANITYDLGTSTQRWKDLWLSNSTIYLGNAQISANATAVTITNPAGGTTVLQGATPIITAAVISASGNVTGGNVLTGGLISAAGNITGGNLSGTNIVGTLTTASQTNITAVGTLDALTVTANTTSGNLLTGGLISATGNITGGNILGGANVNATTHTGTTVLVTANVTGGNVLTGGLISAAGNITGGNVNAGNITIAGDLISSLGATLTIDPATVGDAGLVVINGNLQVNGTTTTINSNVVSTNDLTVNYANNAVNASAANGGGIEVGPIGSPYITWLYDSTANVWTSSAGISAVGNITGGNILGGANVNATTHTGTTVSVSANITGGNLLTAGLILATGNITGGNVIANGVRVYKWTTVANTAPSGAVPGDNWYDSYADKLYLYVNDGTGNQWIDQSFPTTFANLTVSGNTSSGNLLTAGLVSATGNITGNYIFGNGALLTGVIASVSNINSGTSNVTVVSSGGNVSVGVGGTGNVAVFATTGEYVTGLISATGNVTGNFFIGNGSQLTGIASTYGNANVVANLAALGSNPVSTTGNITGGNILGGANVNATTHTGTTVSVTANITGGNLLTAGLVSATGNITGGNFVGTLNGSGANVTSISATNISSGTLTQARLANAAVTLGSTALTLGSTVTTVAGLTSVTSTTFVGALTGAATSATTAGTVTTAAQPNITSVGTLSSVTISGVTTVGGAITRTAAGTGYFNGNYPSAETVNSSGAIYSIGGSYVPQATSLNNMYGIGYGYSGGTANVGGSSGVPINRWGMYVATAGVSRIFLDSDNSIVYAATFSGVSTTAKYADLAELYSADAEYLPGTVVDFGGTCEITLSVQPGSNRIAGVVSTNPAHLMNSTLQSTHTAAIALSGRVPTLVVGPVRKGDMMVSAGNGHAQACATPAMGTVIGKAVEDFVGASGTIEIAVGRL